MTFEKGSYEAWREGEKQAYREMADRMGHDAFRQSVARNEARAKAEDMGHSFNAGLRILREVADDLPKI